MRLPIATATILACLATLAGTAAGTGPVSGSIFGPVLSVAGSHLVVGSTQVAGGKAAVSLGSATVVSERLPGTRADLKRGACATAAGRKAKDGTVAAMTISLTAPVKGSCTAGFRGGLRPGGTRRRPAAGARRPPANFRNGSFGFAGGAISAVSGSTLTVHGRQGSTKVTVSTTTRITKTARVPASAIHAKDCVFVSGTSGDKGKSVRAQRIELSRPTGSGCSLGFRGRPGG